MTGIPLFYSYTACGSADEFTPKACSMMNEGTCGRDTGDPEDGNHCVWDEASPRGRNGLC